MILTKYAGTFIGPVAVLLGILMDGIFRILNLIGIPNVGLAIIIFTIVVYMCLLPLTIKQQKFSKLSARMNPELQAVQAKYKGKRDNDSMMKMQEETKAVYAKYGVTQSGTCLPLLIQMPIMFALYRVIYAMPAYVTQIKGTYIDLVTKLSNMDGVTEFLKTFKGVAYFSRQFSSAEFVKGSEFMQNTYIDVLNKASSAEWASLADKFPNLSVEIADVAEKISHYNNFLGLNIGNNPLDTIRTSLAEGNYLLVVGALLVPLLAAFTQWFNTQLMPQPAANDNGDNPMMQSMKTMNVMMPLMSAFMCFTLPAGLGLYWIAGAVIRCVQQVIINKHFDKMDIDQLIEDNKKKYEEKQKELIGSGKVNKTASTSSSTISSRAAKGTKNISFDYDNYSYEAKPEVHLEADKKNKKAKNDNASSGIAAKANKLKNMN